MIRELAFPKTPEAMVYMRAIDEVIHAPDSLVTQDELEIAIGFCKEKMPVSAIEALRDMRKRILKKQYAEASDQASALRNTVYEQ